MKSSPSNTFAYRSARGFTLVEASVVIIIIALIASIALTALNGARKSARKGAEQQFLATLKAGVEQFKQQFGILPPLIDDSNPFQTSGQATRVQFRGYDAADPTAINKYLAGEINPTGWRYSEMSIPMYLLGAGSAKVDGVDGLGMTEIDRNTGQFTRKGRQIPSLVTIEKEINRFTSDSVNDGRSARLYDLFKPITDPARPAIRYYRWEPTFYTKADAPTPDAIGQVKKANVPAAVGDVTKNPELRSARFAIVSPGPDRLFNDTDPSAPENKDNLVEVGQ